MKARILFVIVMVLALTVPVAITTGLLTLPPRRLRSSTAAPVGVDGRSGASLTS